MTELEEFKLWADYDELFQTAIYLKKSGVGMIQFMSPKDVMYDIFTALATKYKITFEDVEESLGDMDNFNDKTKELLFTTLSLKLI